MLSVSIALFTMMLCGPFAYLAVKLPMPMPYKLLYLGAIGCVATVTFLLGRQLA
ncbi:hypothetical protein [Brucella pituitosa]|uniref:hypothetical protein n=1 Tax=Brucella pituitosa TaxID=571256 RepID=UPI0013748004|nr:hypothetical protein [Brucella pituitosa]